MDAALLLTAPAAASALLLLSRLKTRLELSKAKHPSLRGHARWSRRLARLIPYYEYRDDEIFAVDGAPEDVQGLRRAGFERLATALRRSSPKTLAATAEAAPGVSDMQFTSAYRVPFQFSRYVRERLQIGSFMDASHGVMLRDLDGNELFDLTGSYGVNVFGYDFYKACMDEANRAAHDLGPVLGYYHPVLVKNVARLRRYSGMDEVSFHMSGTEAVMQAVRLARYHTCRTHLVRFCGAYHGWWGDVQPGVGNPQTARETYTLKDMSENSLRVLRRRKDIACVLVNPLQALHPNQNAPSDGTLLASERKCDFDREAYAAWLRQLRQVCSERGIVLIFDEVFVGFRLGPRGAQEYFGVEPDMVTYGKTLGGGLPVGVVCGKRHLMQRFRPKRPADVCFARGTFNSHPYVMTAMNAFLDRIESPEIVDTYARADATWNRRAKALNAALARRSVPVQVANLQSIFSVMYTTPSRYNWMFQYYLRDEGLALSWIGTGRFIFSLDYSEEAFQTVVERIVRAGEKMKQDGFWWYDAALTNEGIKRRVLKEMWQRRG